MMIKEKVKKSRKRKNRHKARELGSKILIQNGMTQETMSMVVELLPHLVRERNQRTSLPAIQVMFFIASCSN